MPSGAAGAAITFASTPTAGMPGSSRSSSGPHASCAASATASGRRSQRGIRSRRPRAPSSGVASSRMPAVATTDSANPGCSACHGSARSSTITAAPRAGRATARLPPKPEASTTTAITAARCTLGSGPTTKTKQASAAAASASRVRRPAPSIPAPQTIAPVTSAQFAPETATRCVRELCRIRSSSARSTSAVSPTAKPGTSAAPATREAASRRPRRSAAAARAARDGSPAGPFAGGAMLAELTRTPYAADDPASSWTSRPRTNARFPGPQPTASPAASAKPITLAAESPPSQSTSGTEPPPLPAVSAATQALGGSSPVTALGNPPRSTSSCTSLRDSAACASSGSARARSPRSIPIPRSTSTAQHTARNGRTRRARLRRRETRVVAPTSSASARLAAPAAITRPAPGCATAKAAAAQASRAGSSRRHAPGGERRRARSWRLTP